MTGLKIGFFQGMRAKDIFRYSLLAALFIYLSANLSAQSDNGTEFGIADDLTVLGVQGTAIDPDVELKGFTVFGATQAAYTGAIIGPGNVVVNGALAVSSGAYFTGNSTFTAAGKIFINDGSTGQLLRKNTGGWLEWFDSSAIGDNLGNHTATQNLKLNGNWLSNDGGNEGIRIDNSGLVGVGVAAPQSMLDVGGQAAFGATTKSTFTAAGVLQLASALTVGYGGTGGTGLTSDTVLLGNGSNPIATTNLGIADQILRIASAGGAPSFGSVDLSKSAAVGASVLGAVNGGTGLNSISAGQLLYGSGANVVSALAGPGSAGQALRASGAGSFAWASPLAADIDESANRWVNVSGDTMSGQLTLAGSSLTVTGAAGVGAAQLRLAANVIVSSETSVALGGGVRVSTNVYIVGFSSAAKYYGDGSSLTGIAGLLSGGQTPMLPYWTSANALGNSNLSRDSATSLTAVASTFTVQGSAFSVGGSTFVVSGGNVGIGTTGPGGLLDVRGAAYIGARTDAALSAGGLNIRQQAAAEFLGWTDGSVQGVLGGVSGYPYIGSKNNADFAIYTNNAPKVTIQAGGNVGIGTAAPMARLQVDGTVRIRNRDQGDNIADFRMMPGPGDTETHLYHYNTDGRFGIHKYGTGSPGGEVFTILNSGNIGIGTIGPAVKLDVAQNAAIKVGNAYLSSGGDYTHLANNEWYNGGSWTTNGSAGVLYQQAGQINQWYTHDAAGAHTTRMALDASGNLTLSTGKVKANNVGVVYTRWGRTVCPAGNTLVYDGYVAGSHYTHSSGSNRLCLSKTPTWDVYNDANLDHSLIYGAEYETSGGQIGLDTLHDYEVPCAVCLVEDAGAQFMYPGSQVCPSGWTTQYAGYLMGQQYQQTAGTADFLCVDRAAQGIGTNANSNGTLLYSTEGECGALPCPPYVQNREITCSVCTR